MAKLLVYIKLFTGFVISGISYILGGFDMLFSCLTTLMIIDYVTGVFAAICNAKLCSRTGFVGIIKKLCIFAVVAVATVLGHISGIDEVRDLAVSFYIANEGISILENLGKIGIPLPEKLKTVLLQLKEEEK